MIRAVKTHIELVMGIGLSFVSFIVYLNTLCPTLNFIDSGELATVASTLGIAHPTGYPLFTLIGWVFAHLPLGFRVIYQLNIMSAFLCSVGLFFFFIFLVFLFKEILSPKKNSEKGYSSKFYQTYLPAGFGTLLLGFSETYWSQSVSVEVYSLHVVFLSVLLFIFTKAMHVDSQLKTHKQTGAQKNIYRFIFAFLLGLSFTNHMTTIFLAPGFLYLYFSTYGFSSKSWKTIAHLVLPFVLGFSLYLYLPYRASQQPLFNWGNPIDVESFFRHTSGKQYSVWLFSSAETARMQFNNFLETLPAEFSYIALLLAPIGVWSFFKSNKKVFLFSLLLFLGCVLYAINYDIHDIESYFLLAYLVIALWSAAGVRHILYEVSNLTVRKLVAGVAILLLIVECGINFKRVNLNDMVLVEGYTKDMFQSIEPNGIIISFQWDYFVSASYYLQYVENVRRDVVVIDKELLRRSWYFKQLEQHYPWLIARSRIELDAFMVELQKFEQGLPYNPGLIELRFSNLIKSFVEKNISSRPVYVTQEIEQQYTTGYQRIPSGLAFRLYSDTSKHELPILDFNIQMPSRNDKYVDGIIRFYAQSYLNNALYSNFVDKKETAMLLTEKALSTLPTMPEALEFKERLKRGM